MMLRVRSGRRHLLDLQTVSVRSCPRPKHWNSSSSHPLLFTFPCWSGSRLPPLFFCFRFKAGVPQHNRSCKSTTHTQQQCPPSPSHYFAPLCPLSVCLVSLWMADTLIHLFLCLCLSLSLPLLCLRRAPPCCFCWTHCPAKRSMHCCSYSLRVLEDSRLPSGGPALGVEPHGQKEGHFREDHRAREREEVM